MESALRGLRVLDFTQALAGPFATMLLADLGAEVIKIEPPGSRRDIASPMAFQGMHFYFLSVNRNKKSVALDVRQPEGRAVLYELAKSSDVVIDNARPDVPKRLGIDYETLSVINPRIICTSITGFGDTGPCRDRPAYDLTVQAMTGAVSIGGNPGERPVRNAVPVADQGAAFIAVAGTLAALWERERTGFGQRVETSLFAATLYQMAYEVALYTVTGHVQRNIGSSHVVALPYGVYPTADGWIAIAAPFRFDALCCAIERPDLVTDERFDKMDKLALHREALDAELQDAFRRRTTAEWLQLLEQADVPCGPVNDLADALHHPQVEATQMLANVPHVRGGTVRLVGTPLRLSGGRDDMREQYASPPLLGQHTREVLAGLLGYDEQRLRELAEHDIIAFANA